MIDPIQDLIESRKQARENQDPMTDLCFLATVAGEGSARVRALVLRDISEQGPELVFSANSPKWQQLEATGSYELCILWMSLRRQYRLRGGFERIPEDKLEEVWQRKSHGSRLLDSYYSQFQVQSSPIASREELLSGIDELRKKHPTSESVPRPADLLGLRLVARHIERWQALSDDRLHDRRLFTLGDEGWSEQVIVP